MGESSYKIKDKHLRAGSHLPILAKLLVSTDGAVLELGCGYYSTPLLSYYCLSQGRHFESYENDLEWAKKFEELGTRYITDWDVLDHQKNFWSFALVDQRPALQRHKDAIKLSMNSQFVVLHDTEPEIDKFYAYRRVWKHFKFRYDFDYIKPYTTILSNYIDPKVFFGY